MIQKNNHQNVDQQFVKTIRFEKDHHFAIFGLQDQSILPSLAQKMRKGCKGVLYFSREAEEKNLKNYLSEYGFLEKLIARIFNLRSSIKFKESQFDTIFLLDISYLMRDPIVLLSELFRLLKDQGKLYLYLLDNEDNNKVLNRLLKQAEMGEMIGLLEKMGFSNRFLVRTIIDKEIKVMNVIATKVKLTTSFHYEFSELK